MTSPWNRQLMADTQHTLNSDGPDPRGYGNVNLPQRLMIEDPRMRGEAITHRIFMIARGDAARRQNSGPQVPGPWADLSGDAIVIDNSGGSARENRELETAGLIVRCRVGDLFIIDGERFTLRLAGPGVRTGTRGWCRTNYPLLIHESEASE